MMQYEGFAIRLKSEYDLFLFALSGRYLSVMAPGVSVSPMLVTQFEQSASELRETFLKTASRSIADYVGVSDVDTVKALSQGFNEELARVTRENIQSLSSRMKGVKNSELDAVGELHGAMGLLLQRKLSTPEFNVTSVSGRVFKAAPFVKAQARQFAYQTWLQLQMVGFSWEGDLAQVMYDDEGHKNNGLIFSMSGATPGYPSFDDIAETVFHYNATAKIGPYVST
jgi:hypothetical protein